MQKYQAKNLLVTGGAGFIGSNFIHYLLAHDKTVNIINLDLLTYAGTLANLNNLPANDRYHFVKGDIADQALVMELLKKYQIDTIVHFAAESHVDNSIKNPGAFVHTNIVGTFSLLEACRQSWLNEKRLTAQQCRFHHISTDEVFGTLTADEKPFTEQNAFKPNSPYSASKAGSDHLVRAYCKTYALPVTITNCSNNYGPRQHTEKLIPTIIRSCLNWQAIPIYGNGMNIRDWLYVEDHCEAITSVLASGKIGETYNIGGNNEYTNLEVAEKICAYMDTIMPKDASYQSLIKFVKDRPGHDYRYAITIDKIQHELGWSPKESFESGLKKTIDWYIKNNTLQVACSS